LKETEMSKPTISRLSSGLYYFTGWVSDCLVQYSILSTREGWTLTKTYGHGPEFYTAFPTKREAIAALTN